MDLWGIAWGPRRRSYKGSHREGATTGLIKGDTRSSDYSSHQSLTNLTNKNLE